MLTTRCLVQNSDYEIRTVECAEDGAGWSPAETTTATQIVLVQRGRFRVKSGDRSTTVDSTAGYLHPPGQETRFAHPAGGDICTALTLPGERLTTGIDPARAWTVRVDGRLELAHRVLLRDNADPDFATAEAVLELLQLALRRRPEESPAPGRYALADRAREAILADEPGSSGLVDLAALLQTSPAHLSRTFSHHTGMSVSRFRNRVRISRALERLDEGESDLAALASGLGFSDQAHFTRTMRAELGQSPGQVRGLFARRSTDFLRS